MKNILITASVYFGIFFIPLELSAQNQILDKIVLKDSTVIMAKIKTVTEQIIYYQQTRQEIIQDFEILKDFISKIFYGNGDIEIVSLNSEVQLPKKHIRTYPEKHWLNKDVINYLHLYDRKNLLEADNIYLEKIRKLKKHAIVAGTIGATMSIAGIVLLTIGNSRPKGEYFDGLDYILGGNGLLISGATLGIVGTTVNLTRAKKNKKRSQFIQQELQRRDIGMTKIKIYPSFNPRNDTVGLCLAYQF